MKRSELTPLAEQDLEAIWDYIAHDSLAAANRVLDRIEAAVHRLAANPGIAHLREDLADKDHLFYNVYSYLIVFRTTADSIQVIRILHGARDVHRVLGHSRVEDR